jgi:dipeptidyl aminopeptidase/acylaminoacyl peptidase
LYALKSVGDVQLSPDGSRIACTLTAIDRDSDEYRNSIWVVPFGGGEPAQFTRGTKNDTSPRWSPDGQWLAFLSDREGKPAQLYLMPAHGGEAHKLTSLVNGAGPAVWSPDSQTILFAVNVLKETPPDDSEARERWNQRPKVVSRAQFKDDGQGYTFDSVSQLYTIPAAGGEARQLTSAAGASRAPAWSSDARRIAFSRLRDGLTDYNLSDIWVMDVDGGNQHRLTETVGRATSPSWSPDGAWIACFGSEQQTPESGDPVSHLWVVPAQGGDARLLTLAFDRGAVLLAPPAATPGPTWSSDGSTLTYPAAIDGNAHIVRASASDGAVTIIVAGERWVTSMSASARAARIAYSTTDPLNPGDVFASAWDGADEHRLTQVNAELLSGLQLPRIVRRKFNNPNGGTVDGWVIHPLTSTGPARFLLDIHGGPHSFHGNNFSAGYFYRYVMPASGWGILLVNPTGSGSYGKAFAHGIRARWGEHDLPEQMAALDALVAEGLADPDRLAITGYSYGGFMTSWTVGHTARFKAAVIGAPVVNMESFYGTADIGPWFSWFEMKARLADARETYRRLSPIQYVQDVTTPSLILHGEGDDRVPISQGEEFYNGLLIAGKVPTGLVRYPGGSHLFIVAGRPSHRVDFSQRVIEWLNRFVKA